MKSYKLFKTLSKLILTTRLSRVNFLVSKNGYILTENQKILQNHQPSQDNLNRLKLGMPFSWRVSTTNTAYLPLKLEQTIAYPTENFPLPNCNFEDYCLSSIYKPTKQVGLATI